MSTDNRSTDSETAGAGRQHLDEGMLWALADGAGDLATRVEAEAHLAGCGACRALAERVAASRDRLDLALSSLVAEPAARARQAAGVAHREPGIYDPFGDMMAGADPVAARSRLDQRLAGAEPASRRLGPTTPSPYSDQNSDQNSPRSKGASTMNSSPSPWRRFTPAAWLRLAAIFAVALLLALPPVRAAATSFLKLFRVQKVTVLPVDPNMLMSGNMGGSAALEQLISTDVHSQPLGETLRAHNSTEAAKASGLTVRLPARAPGAPRIEVSPGTDLRFKVDLQRVQDVVDAMGKDITLPPSLDGAEISARLSPVVIAAYGPCATEPPDKDKIERRGWPEGCTVFTQTSSPNVSAPAGLPIEELGRTYLELLGMTPDEAERFGQQVDWTSTLVIPVPRYGTASREVPVDGVSGTLIEHASDERAPGYFLIWLKDGVVYALSGSGSSEQGMALAASLTTSEVQGAPGTGGPTD